MVSQLELSRRFTVADYSVFVAMLVVSAAIGIFHACTGNKQSTTSEFLFGGRAMKIVPVAMSVLATFLSAITLLGIPAETYQFGTQYWMINIAYCFMIPAAAHIYIPVFYKMQVSSIYEYLEKRFSRFIRTVAFVISTLTSLIYMAFVVYAPSLVLSQVTGLHPWLCVLSIGIVCTFYTTIGGIKAVIWTDVFQTLIIFGAMFVVVIKGVGDVGGIENVWAKAKEGQRVEFFNIDTDPTARHTLWSLSIGGFFTWLCIYAVNQAMVQRSLTIPTLRGAITVIWLNLPGNILTVTITCLAGLVIYANYSTCDPINTKQVSSPNQVFPLFVMDTLGFLPGLPGLFVAGIFSGALSTLSSSLNSLSAVTLEDLVRAHIAPNMTEIWATRTAKLLAFAYGVIAIILVIIVEQLSGTVLQAALSLSGSLGGPLLGLFSLGMFFPWPTTFGAITGLISGLAISLWICVGAIIYKRPLLTAPLSVESCQDLYFNVTGATRNMSQLITDVPTMPSPGNDIFVLYRLSYLWYSVIGFVVVIVIGLISSLLTGKNEKENIDPIVMCPIFYKLWNCGKRGQLQIQNGTISHRVSSAYVNGAMDLSNGSLQTFHLTKPTAMSAMWTMSGVYRKNSNAL